MSTSLVNSVLLATGEQTTAAILTVGTEERIGFRFTTVQVGTADCQARLVILDADGHVEKTVLIDGSGTEEVHVDQVDGNLTYYVECRTGSVRVSVDQLDGAEKLGELTGSIVTADIADLAVTTGKIALTAVDTAQLAAGAATPAKIDVTGMKFLRFDGRNGAGAITLTGAAVGDRVMAILGVVSATGVSVVGALTTGFEPVITIVDQIQQADAADLSGNDYWVILLPAQA